MSELRPSGNEPTTRLPRRISLFSCSITLFTRIRHRCSPRLIPNNLKTGVVKHPPRKGEVASGDRYRALMDHYSTAVLPARVGHPKDKPSTENTVWHTTMAVIGAIRDRAFVSLSELRKAICERLAAYNATPFQKREGSLLSVFERMKPLLTPLPAVRFDVTE